LLAAIKTLFAETGKNAITSEAIVAKLRADPTDIWIEYNRGGPITQRQAAWLLDPYDSHPVNIHPTGQSNFSPKGYKLEQFADAWARYLP
jgi:uncharacterized protein DUF3631